MIRITVKTLIQLQVPTPPIFIAMHYMWENSVENLIWQFGNWLRPKKSGKTLLFFFFVLVKPGDEAKL